MIKPTHCVASLDACTVAYGTPEALDIAPDFEERDDGTIAGPVAACAAFALAHGFDLAKFDDVNPNAAEG